MIAHLERQQLADDERLRNLAEFLVDAEFEFEYDTEFCTDDGLGEKCSQMSSLMGMPSACVCATPNKPDLALSWPLKMPWKNFLVIRIRGRSQTPLLVQSVASLTVVQAWGNGIEVQGAAGSVSLWRGILVWLTESVTVLVPVGTTVDLLIAQPE